MSLVSNLNQRLMTSLDDHFPGDVDDYRGDAAAFKAALRAWFRASLDPFLAELGATIDPAPLDALLDELVETLQVAFDAATISTTTRMTQKGEHVEPPTH
jgi:hypothetical protein